MLQKLKARQGLWLHNLFGLIWQTELELNPSHAKEQNETTTIVRHLSKYLTIGAHLMGQELVLVCCVFVCTVYVKGKYKLDWAYLGCLQPLS